MCENFILLNVKTDTPLEHPYMICVIKCTNGIINEPIHFKYRPEIDKITKKNILPRTEDVSINMFSYEDMLIKFGSWWLQNNKDHEIIWHWGSFAEINLFKKMAQVAIIDPHDVPEASIKVTTLFNANEHTSHDVKTFIKNNKIVFLPDVLSKSIGTDNTIHDAIATAEAYLDFCHNSNNV